MLRPRGGYLAAALTAALLVNTARADLSAPTPRKAAGPSAEALGPGWNELVRPDGALPGIPVTARPAADPEASAELLTLTPGPSSADLFLWALGGFGVWQLGRSARRWQWAVVPSWYHAGGPNQVGHATPLDLDFSRASLAVVSYGDLLRPTDGAVPRCLQRERRAAPPARYLPRATDPRGPPHS